MVHRFYFITDRKKFKKPFLDTIKEVLDKGIRLFQIREKDLPDNELFKLTEDVLKIAEDYDVKIIINSRLDIALLLNLDGVHLPENGLPIEPIKKKFPNLIVGKSCHSLECGIQAYQDGADYIFISPIFQVEGKAPPIGVEKLREIVNKLPLPVYALGGINKFNVQSVLDTGVYGIASIRYFLD